MSDGSGITWIGPFQVKKTHDWVKEFKGTVGELLTKITQEECELKPRLLNHQGQLHSHLRIFINKKDFRAKGGMDCPVHPGDRIEIIQALAGG